MGRLSRQAQERILVLRSERVKIGEIVEKLGEEGMPTTRQTVSRFLRVSSERTTRLNTDNSTSGEKQKRPKSKLNKEHLAFINKEIESDAKLNVGDLQDLLQEHFDLEVTAAAIKRARKKLGWVRTGPRNIKIPVGPCQDHETIIACLTQITEQQQIISQKLDRLENRFVLLQTLPSAYQLMPTTLNVSTTPGIPNSSNIPIQTSASNQLPSVPCGNDLGPLMPPVVSTSENSLMTIANMNQETTVPDSFSFLANIYNLTTNDLFALSRKSTSIGNFALKLVNTIFRSEELAGRNCNGKLGKLPLDPSRLSVVKDAVYHVYSVPDVSRAAVWKKCVISIDEALRRPKSKAGAKKQPVYVQLPSMTDLHLIAESSGTVN